MTGNKTLDGFILVCIKYTVPIVLPPSLPPKNYNIIQGLASQIKILIVTAKIKLLGTALLSWRKKMEISIYKWIPKLNNTGVLFIPMSLHQKLQACMQGIF